MGTWLNSLHIHSTDRKGIRSVAEKVAREHGAKFMIGPTRKGWIALLIDFTSMSADLVKSFAAECPAPLFHVTVADDDEFQYVFHRDGRLVDRHSTRAPADVAGGSEEHGWQGQPERFADLFRKSESVRQCEALLAQPRFTFESERWYAMCKLLGIPQPAYCFADFEGGDDAFPGAKQFIPVPDHRPSAREMAKERAAKYRELAKKGWLLATVPLLPPGPNRSRLLQWRFEQRTAALLLHTGSGSLFAPQWSHFRLPKPWTGEPVPDAAISAPEPRVSSQTPQIDHPDGRHIMATGLKGEILVRDRETGELRQTITCHSGIDPGKGDWAQRSPDAAAQVPPHLSPEQHNLWRVRQANAERFYLLLFSPDQSWFATGSSWGMRVWRTADLLAGGPPCFSCEGRFGDETSGSGSTYCYAIAFDESRSLVIFAGREGIVEALDLRTGRVATLLDPPERLTILRLQISPDGEALAVEAFEAKRNSDRLPELRLWNYPALCEAAGLPPPA